MIGDLGHFFVVIVVLALAHTAVSLFNLHIHAGITVAAMFYWAHYMKKV